MLVSNSIGILRGPYLCTNLNKSQRNNSVTTKHPDTVTIPYLSNLIINQFKHYSNADIVATVLVKKTFIKVMQETSVLTSEENDVVLEWAAYVFEDEDKVPLSLAIVRANSLLHQVEQDT